MQKTFPGEPLEKIFPAFVEIRQFWGARIYRIIGSEEDVKETTDMIQELHPNTEKETMGDAQWLRNESPGIGVYQLLVVEKV